MGAPFSASIGLCGPLPQQVLRPGLVRAVLAGRGPPWMEPGILTRYGHAILPCRGQLARSRYAGALFRRHWFVDGVFAAWASSTNRSSVDGLPWVARNLTWSGPAASTFVPGHMQAFGAQLVRQFLLRNIMFEWWFWVDRGGQSPIWPARLHAREILFHGQL